MKSYYLRGKLPATGSLLSNFHFTENTELIPITDMHQKKKISSNLLVTRRYLSYKLHV